MNISKKHYSVPIIRIFRDNTGLPVSPVRALSGLDPGGDHELGGAGRDLLASHHDLLELAAAQHNPAKLKLSVTS